MHNVAIISSAINYSGCFTCQQSTLSNIGNSLPGGNGIGIFHDTWSNRYVAANGVEPPAWFNVSTMLPSAIIALPAAYDQSGLRYVIPPVIQLNQDQQKQRGGGN